MKQDIHAKEQAMEIIEENRDNVEVELDGVRSPEAQAIIDAELGIEKEGAAQEEEDVELPSDEGQDEPDKYAGRFDSLDELKKGINNIGSNLPEYVLNGMSPEALEQHYTELRKEFSKSGKEGRKHAVKDETVEDKPKSDDKPEAVSEELWSELDATFTKGGSITSEQYDKLNAVGIPDAMIDRYLDSLKSEQVRFTQDIYDMAGGQEQYSTIKEWAEEGGIPEAELEAVSRLTDYTQIKLAMAGVKARYDMANVSSQGNTLRGNTGGVRSSGYKSQQDYMSDVSDPRYRTDERFRDKVKSKLERSSLT